MAFQPRFLKHKGITVIQKLDPSVQRKILGENAAKLYKL